ncbi:MAG: tyrosine-type recombinase/integrase [Desulfatirhabdiaceae bacterium]
MNLAECIHKYFEQYLPQIRGASQSTIDSYQQALTLFLKFSSDNLNVPVKEIDVKNLSFQLIIDFLDHLQTRRNYSARTRNTRLACLKSLAKMIRLSYPEHRNIAEMILGIPQKRCQKRLIGFLTQEEMQTVFKSVDLKKHDGFRDYTLLHLLFDSGARASEIASLKLDDFNPQQKTLAILGKGNRYRIVQLWTITTDLMTCYIKEHRPKTQNCYADYLFINQRKQHLTRHGIYFICSKYLEQSLPEKRLKWINPAHSFRHSCAVNMLQSGSSLTDIKNHLGHENLNSTMTYLNLSLSKKTEVQKSFIEYTQSHIKSDPKINDLIDWENKDKILTWLDSL